MKESNLWNNLRDKLKEVLWQRVETAGVATYILVGTDKRTLHLFSGLDAREVRDQGLKHPSLLELSAPYDWEALRNILFCK